MDAEHNSHTWQVTDATIKCHVDRLGEGYAA